MEKQMVIRINPELKDKVANLAKSEGKSSSQLIRELLEEYVRKRDMGGYVDSLWSRIGERLGESGAGPQDIEDAVKKVRESR